MTWMTWIRWRAQLMVPLRSRLGMVDRCYRSHSVSRWSWYVACVRLILSFKKKYVSRIDCNNLYVYIYNIIYIYIYFIIWPFWSIICWCPTHAACWIPCPSLDVGKSGLRSLQAAQRPMANPKKMRWSKAEKRWILQWHHVAPLLHEISWTHVSLRILEKGCWLALIHADSTCLNSSICCIPTHTNTNLCAMFQGWPEVQAAIWHRRHRGVSSCATSQWIRCMVDFD